MQLHFDENIPDLGDQIRQSYGVDGNHQYFLEPYLSADPQFAAWIPLVSVIQHIFLFSYFYF